MSSLLKIRMLESYYENEYNFKSIIIPRIARLNEPLFLKDALKLCFPPDKYPTMGYIAVDNATNYQYFTYQAIYNTGLYNVFCENKYNMDGEIVGKFSAQEIYDLS